jgi:hypothetical protein
VPRSSEVLWPVVVGMAVTGSGKPTVHRQCSRRFVRHTKNRSRAQLVPASSAGYVHIHAHRYASLRNDVRPPDSCSLHGILVRARRVRCMCRSICEFSGIVGYVYLRHHSDHCFVFSRGAKSQAHDFHRCCWSVSCSRAITVSPLIGDRSRDRDCARPPPRTRTGAR